MRTKVDIEQLKKSLGGRIQISLIEEGCSRATLAKKIRVHPSTIGLWIRNEKEPGINKVRLMAQHLNKDLTWLIIGEARAEDANRKVGDKLSVAEEIKAYKTKFEQLNDENKKLIIELIEKLLKGQKDEDVGRRKGP